MLRTAIAAVLLAPSFALASEPDAKQLEFFENKIRPVLVENCYRCHSADAAKKKKLKGGLQLDTKAGWLKGGDTGPAIVPGKPKRGHSSQVAARTTTKTCRCRRRANSTDAVIADFEKWIARWCRRPADGDAVAAAASTIDFEKGKQFWCFKPPKEPPVPEIQNANAKTQDAIDAFIAAKWAEKGSDAGPAADKRTLIRRVYFDLIGLPPSPEEVDAFLADSSPTAFAKVVDKSAR